MTLRFLIGFALVCGSLACSPTEQADEPAPRAPMEDSGSPPTFALPRPNVVMEADPPPPFTYWAPEAATIRNHGNPGIWIAVVDGRNVKTYFGDQCLASQWQRYVGQPLSVLPPAPAGMTVRPYCTTCAKTDDLRGDRINVVFDEATQTIQEIGCH